jgi:hypothetical protein
MLTKLQSIGKWIWNTIAKQSRIKTTVIILLILYVLFWPAKHEQASVTVAVSDSVANKEQIEKYKEMIKEKNGIIAGLLNLHTEGRPTLVTSSRPSKSPLDKQEVPVDTNKKNNELGLWPTIPKKTDIQRKEYPYDFPFSMEVNDDEISITALNPFLESFGSDFVKTYHFPRKAQNFRLGLLRTNKPDGADGIRMIFDNKVIDWQGFYVGGAVGFPMTYYFHIKARVVVYDRIALQPELRTQENWAWLTIDWRL